MLRVIFIVVAVLLTGSVGCTPARNMRIRVIDGETNKPLPGAQVSVIRTYWQPHIPLCILVPCQFPESEKAVDSSGAIELESISSESLIVTAPDHGAAEVTCRWDVAVKYSHSDTLVPVGMEKNGDYHIRLYRKGYKPLVPEFRTRKPYSLEPVGF